MSERTSQGGGTMKTTVKAMLINLDIEQEQILVNLQTLFSSAVRYSYKQLLKGQVKKDIQKTIQCQYKLNSRYASDVIEQARQIKKAQSEILNQQIQNWTKKVETVKKQISKNKKEDKLDGLKVKLKKREKKLKYWQKFIEINTLPKIIFGGKNNFIQRAKGKISSQEFKATRDNRILSRGDITKKGNPNTRIIVEGEKTYLIINTDQYVTHGKLKRYIQVKVELYLPHKPSKKTGLINGRNYRQMILDYITENKAYQVEIIKKNGHFYCHITIEEDAALVITNKHLGILGIDTNPDGLALTQISADGNFKKSIFIGDGRLIDLPKEPRRQLIGLLTKQAVTIAKENNTAVAIENLKFKDDRDLRRKTARKIHQFVYAKFLQSLEREASRQGVEVIKVNPAYTSIIGKYKYQKQFGLTTHQAAAMVIARRAYNFKERLPKAVRNILPKKVKESNKHHWSKWYVANKTILKIRKEGASLDFLVV